MRAEAYRIREGLIVRYAFLKEAQIHDYVGTSGQYMIIKHSFEDEQVYKIIKDFFNSTAIPGIADIHFGFVNIRTSQVGWRFKPEQPHFAPDYLYYQDGISKIPPDDLLPLLDVSDTSIAKHFGVIVS
ncbi:hypothetical protein IW146_004044 [Coemansia sp. RSA 922]|nr:hypothetical protein LPJ71_002284 [Coemansia sp. S17]KAJ2039483.1 hypothetical protein H4S03_001669 [Coemansia sp. S3946]KAJ2052198.1 hypothetical protein H4S04_001492 [Coemansia sp. S16]KAJ2066027.1 hypothetical protein GGI08_002067 [Coemansia sp. S2]KAJ2073102.1 hypothetical protein GGH13_002232 [Coemansia sp. S155-1]KAJ2106257.1 hypothetical protein GGI16_002002 [Coemansia sp. S142-1]KAJ2113197.1 hypothetical protein IW146_004044 [Coemansia sp. RSA 922]KAJ2353865.1 hypothetical protein